MPQRVDQFIPVQNSNPNVIHGPRPGAAQVERAASKEAPASRGISIDGVISKAKHAVSAATPPYRPPAGPLHVQYMSKPKVQQRVASAAKPAKPPAMDFVRRAAPQAQAPVHSQPRPATTNTSLKSLYAKVSPANTNPHQVADARSAAEAPQRMSTWSLLVIVAVTSLAIFSSLVGQIGILIYAILAIWKRWSSQQTFYLALMMFGGIILTYLLPPFRHLAGNLAIYAFLLLGVGALSLHLESKRNLRRQAG
jgi:hypothetical protein